MRKYIIAILVLAAAATGCKKDWLDINTNPNSLPTASPNYVFTNAATTSARVLIAPNELGSYWSGQWTQSNSYILSSSIFSYTFTNTDFNYWDNLYNNLQDYEYVVTNADANNQAFLKGPARVMKAYIFQMLVDMYGNIPYTDALRGVKSLAPKFDNQEDVYENLLALLDTAIMNLKANSFPGSFKSSDVVFAGNTTKWVKFANSLKMRILIRQSRIPGRDNDIITEINKAVAEGTGFLGAGEDMGVNPGWQPSDGKMNPFYETWGYNAAGAVKSLGRYPRLTKYLFDELKADNDTFRLKRIAYAKGGENTNNPGVSAQPELVSNYVGVPFGAGSGYTAQATSYVGPSVLVKGQYNKPVILMTAAESQFLLAEAKERYGASVTIPSSSQQYYEQGVRESFRLLGATSAQATALLTGGATEADWAASPNKLQAIWKQKWYALVNFTGFEAWTEYRRTNYPVTPPSISASTPPPVRLYYPSTEKGSNDANVSAQGAINVTTSRLFWDVD